MHIKQHLRGICKRTMACYEPLVSYSMKEEWPLASIQSFLQINMISLPSSTGFIVYSILYITFKSFCEFHCMENIRQFALCIGGQSSIRLLRINIVKVDGALQVSKAGQVHNATGGVTLKLVQKEICKEEGSCGRKSCKT